MENLTIRLESEQDFPAVEALIRDAFWNVYKPGCDEHYYAHCLRRHPDFVPELDLVLEKEGRIIGSIMYSRTALIREDGLRKEILSFGPLCIAPEYQRRGYGTALMERSFTLARKLGCEAVVILGSPANYVGRGFVSCHRKGVTLYGSYPSALLVKELVPGALDDGPWQFIDSKAALCCEDSAAVEAFDATFPPREKAWSASQEAFYIYSRSRVVR